MKGIDNLKIVREVFERFTYFELQEIIKFIVREGFIFHPKNTITGKFTIYLMNKLHRGYLRDNPDGNYLGEREEVKREIIFNKFNKDDYNLFNLGNKLCLLSDEQMIIFLWYLVDDYTKGDKGWLKTILAERWEQNESKEIDSSGIGIIRIEGTDPIGAPEYYFKLVHLYKLEKTLMQGNGYELINVLEKVEPTLHLYSIDEKSIRNLFSDYKRPHYFKFEM